jgi:hypothetical protein
MLKGLGNLKKKKEMTVSIFQLNSVLNLKFDKVKMKNLRGINVNLNILNDRGIRRQLIN